jgi:hypothetical protein
MILALVFFRGGGLVVVTSVPALDWRHYRPSTAIPALAGGLMVESMVLMWGPGGGAKSGRPRRRATSPSWSRRWPIGAGLTVAADGHTWVYFMYSFCVITCYGIGIAFLRLSAVIAVTMALSGGYALSAIAIHHDPGWNVMPNAATYFGNTAAAWAVARALRRGGCSADASQAEAVARAEELARER